jgi:hypothetical protein
VCLNLWSLLVFIFGSCFKKVDWCWKRVNRFMLRLYHVMLGIILIICLIVIVVSWIVSNDRECLMCLWKNHALFLSYGSIFLWYSPLMLYLGSLGACLHHVWLKPIASSLYDHLVFDFWYHFMLLVNNVLSLCMIMAVIALLVGRSQSFASLHLY